MQYLSLLLKLTWMLAVSALLSVAHAAPIVVQAGPTTLSLGDQLHFFEDADNRLSISDIQLEGNARQFTPSRQNYLRFGYTRSTFWLRFDLRNASDQNLPLILELERASLGTAQLYVPTENSYQMQEAGVQTAHPSGALQHRTPVFTLNLPAHSSQRFFVRLDSSQRMDLSVNLYDPASFAVDQNNRQLLHGLAGGLLIGICLYSMLVSLFTKERGFLHYSVYLLAVTAWIASNMGYLGVRWLAYPGLQNIIEQEMGLITLAANTLFARHFLNIQNISTKLDKVMMGTVIMLMAALLFIFIPHSAQIHLWMFICSSVVLIFTALRVWVAGYTPTLFYLLARIPLTIATVINGLGIFADAIRPVSLDAVILIALVFDAVVISLGLGDRFRNWQL
ncbi:MAG TPA: 7TM-DISM domain-containing protein, partial [Pseudomonadales bacterium]|nr:7TM-DISM domain-containing protein [Pseudomonadales bacterium]